MFKLAAIFPIAIIEGLSYTLSSSIQNASAPSTSFNTLQILYNVLCSPIPVTIPGAVLDGSYQSRMKSNVLGGCPYQRPSNKISIRDIEDFLLRSVTLLT